MHRSSETRFSQQIGTSNEAAEVGTTPILISTDEAARLLNVSSRTVWSLTDSGSLPHVRIGRRVLYPLDALRRWTAERTRGGASQ